MGIQYLRRMAEIFPMDKCAFPTPLFSFFREGKISTELSTGGHDVAPKILSNKHAITGDSDAFIHIDNAPTYSEPNGDRRAHSRGHAGPIQNGPIWPLPITRSTYKNDIQELPLTEASRRSL